MGGGLLWCVKRARAAQLIRREPPASAGGGWRVHFAAFSPTVSVNGTFAYGSSRAVTVYCQSPAGALGISKPKGTSRILLPNRVPGND